MAGLGDNPNFATLAGRDEYGRYFDLLSTVTQRLRACYRAQDQADTHEAGVVATFMEKLLATMGLLRIKYTYTTTGTRPLWIDLTESGFPNAMELSQVQQDLARRRERLLELPVPTALKRAILDGLLQDLTDPVELLAQLSERTYFDLLDESTLFLPFVLGELVARATDPKYRSYVISWACYDFQTNRPYVHVMTFDQDIGEDPLERHGPGWDRFLEVLRAEGSRAPDVGILALAIDDALESIHPKIVKRLCIGPLYTPLLLARGASDPGDAPSMFATLLQRHGRRPDDFVLQLCDEVVFSKAQQVTRSLLSPRGKVREIFAITETDPECYARRASVVHQNVMLPHDLLQHLEPAIVAAAPMLRRCRKITYDESGTMVVHG